MNSAMVSSELTGRQVLAVLLYGPLVVIGLFVLWVVWLVGGALASTSLLRHRDLLTTSSATRMMWRAAVWVPILGPAAYGAALLGRYAMLGQDGWRRARSRPAEQAMFVPKGVIRQASAAKQNCGGAHQAPW